MSDNNQRRNKPDSAQGMVGGGSGGLRELHLQADER